MHALDLVTGVEPDKERARHAVPRATGGAPPGSSVELQSPALWWPRLRRWRLGYRQGYAVLSGISHAAFLGLLWLVACLPVVTVIPSTTALFAVTRNWSETRTSRVSVQFTSSFRVFFARSLVLEIVYATAVLGAVVNTYTYPLLSAPVVVVFRTCTLGVLLVLAATFPYVLSLLTGYSMPLKRVAGIALLLAVGRPLHTLASFLVAVLAVSLIGLAPPLLIVVVPFAAHAAHKITRSAVARAVPQAECHA